MSKKTNRQRQRQRIVQLLCEDRRYAWEAYNFVREALFYAQEVLEMGAAPDEEAEPDTPFAQGKYERDKSSADRDGRRPERHLTGQQLCHAIRNYALDQYGYMAQAVLNHWGVRCTGDFGEIVYNLIKIEEMKQSPTDRREDFDDVYEFDDVFRRSYQISRQGSRA